MSLHCTPGLYIDRDVDADESVVRLYKEGHSLSEIGRRLNRSSRSICRVVNRLMTIGELPLADMTERGRVVGKTPVRRPSPEQAARSFWARVDKSAGADACWPWLGATRKGYGRVWFDLGDGLADTAAGRVALFLSGVDIPRALFACHHCDTPVCCNPAHLYAGTALQNMADARNRQRFPWQRQPAS